MKFRFYKWLLFGLVILSSSFTPRAGIELISMDLTARTLFQGKSVTGTGTLYYKVEGSELVTKMNTPVDQVVFTSGYAAPELQHDSGEILYVENRTKITRATDQTENIKLIIEF